jgi:hypothetical protein
MATDFYSVTLDGVTDFQSNEFYSWGSGKYIQHARFELDNGNDLDATFNLSGSNWTLEYMHVWSAAGGILRVSDITNGDGRFIRHMTLQEDSVVSLNTTFVDVIDASGSAGSHDITLGVAGAQMINAWGAANRIETGSGFVGSINTGGVGTVHVYGGANSVNTGNQADEIGLFGGFTGLVEAGSGDDLFGTVGGDGGRVWLGDGADRAFLLDGYVDLLGTGSGDDTAVADGGGAGRVQLGDGNDTITVKGGSQLNYVEAGNGNATVTVENGSRIDDLKVREASTVNVLGDGRIREISADEGNLTLTTGSGRINLIDIWRCDTNIDLGSGGAGTVGLYSDQAQSHTFVSSGWVSLLEMDDGQTMNLTLANEGAGLVSLGDLSDTVVIRDGAGVDSLNTREGNDNVSVLNNSWVGTLNLREGADTVLIENSFADAVRLGDGDDRLTMSGNSEVLFTIEGGNGEDWLAGGNGDETFHGGNGNDTIIGGRGYDVATGAAGADIFAFVAGDDVLVITDFEQGVDQIAFVNLPSGFQFQDLAPFVAQDGNDLTVSSGSQQVRLQNTQLSDWSSDDVFFV